MNYFDELCKAMKLLSDEGYAFMGQAVGAAGTAMSNTFRNVPRDRLIELPVAENMQLGMATGIALAGGKIVTCFPRINFVLEAVSQLVQHLDKIPLYSDYRPKVIIRTAVATPHPLDPGPQHLGDYTEALTQMLSTVEVVRLNRAKDIMDQYHFAMRSDRSSLMVEFTELYDS